MTNNTIRTTYDRETVRLIIERATGKSTTYMDIRNLCRPGYALHGSKVRRETFNPGSVGRVARQFTRRRLAAQLGRISPRLLDETHSRECPTCSGLAVEWDGKILCENGHGG